MRVVDLIRDRVGRGDIVNRMRERKFPRDVIKNTVEVYDELGKILCLYNMDGITVNVGTLDDPYHVYGSIDGEEDVDLSFKDWYEWLGYDISTNTLFLHTEVDILISCMLEMCVWGNDRVEVWNNTRIQ